MQMNHSTFDGFAAVTPSDTALVNCRALVVGGAGNLVLNSGRPLAADVTLAVVAGQYVPISLNQGLVKATGTTATGVVALT
jgi:hypothetical protein